MMDLSNLWLSGWNRVGITCPVLSFYEKIICNLECKSLYLRRLTILIMIDIREHGIV